MTFEALNFTDYKSWFFILAFILPMIAAGWMMFFIPKNEKKVAEGKMSAKTEKRVLGLGLLGIVMLSGGTLALSSPISNNITDSNKAIATQNIMKKYDVVNVDWDNERTTTNATKTIFKNNKAEDNLVVKAKDGNSYIFLYEVNKETSEPTLKDVPLFAGTIPEAESKYADMLLKNK